MGDYVLTSEARADLKEISDYIAQDNLDSATRVVSELLAAMRRLADFPGLGHAREELTAEAVRFWTVYEYCIVYRADTKPIEVVAVISGWRDLPRIFSERGLN